MKKLLLLLVFVLMANVALAELAVEKLVDEQLYSKGDLLDIKLRITNSFAEEVFVEISDNNTINGAGFNIECLSISIPGGSSGLFEYKSIMEKIPDYNTRLLLVEAGDLTLSGAQLSFVHPETGNVEVIFSDDLFIDVADSDTEIVLEEINIINLCQQDQMKEKQEEVKKDKQRKQDMEEMQERAQQQSATEQSLNSMQQNNFQDSSAVQEALQKEMEEKKKQEEQQKKMNEELAKKIEADEEFQKEHKEMTDKGYSLENKSVNAVDNNTGDFDYEYKNSEGKEHFVSGNMKDGSIKDMENTAKMEEQLEKSEEYNKMKKELEEQGYNPSGMQYDNNSFEQQFKNDIGENASIKGQFKKDSVEKLESMMQNSELEKKHQSNEELQNLEDKLAFKGFNQSKPAEFVNKNDKKYATKTFVDKDNETKTVFYNYENETVTSKPVILEEERNNKMIIILAVIIAVSLIFGYFMMKANKKDALSMDVKKVFDYKKEAARMLELAVNLFEKGDYKDSYSLVSGSVRLYYSYDKGIEKELTTTQLLRELKTKPKNLKKCLDTCNLVEFAKYKANRKDFDFIYTTAKGLIK